GRPKSAIWDDFDLGESDGKGHYGAKYRYCTQGRWRCGKLSNMEAHLALYCKGEVPEEIRHNWLVQVARRNDKTDIETSDNESISSISSKKFNTKISRSTLNKKYNEINKTLIKTFVCCGITFAIIDNLFFRNLLMLLEPGYNPPRRIILVEHVLDEEAARVKVKIDNILEKEENLTLGDLRNSALDKTIYTILRNNDVVLEQVKNPLQPSNSKKLEIASIVDLSEIIFGGQGNVKETFTTMRRISNMDFDPASVVESELR
ncbi:9993_t:CDS:2, partial [Racocetra fulgida]